MVAAIRLLKNNKVLGLDMMAAEMLEHPIIEHLTALLNVCWTTGQVPEDWQWGVIVKLPKKGNLADCNN
uniref:Uncharacterized protein n=1 Tax=Octopus bimaculoides TaxID=37653 RepID=A0A0L8HWP8_OCTBM